MASDIERPRRLVTLQRDGADFVVSFYPEDIIAFRHSEPNALRKMCAFLRWQIIADKAATNTSMGYDPYDFFDLGEFEQKGSVATWFGRKDELLALIGAAHDTQIQVYADFVIDHCSGADAQEISPIDGVSRWITLCVCQRLDVGEDGI